MILFMYKKSSIMSIRITPEQEQYIIGMMLMEETYPIKPHQVKIIKDFLDNSFTKEDYENNGKIQTAFGKKGASGKVYAYVDRNGLFDATETFCKNMFTSTEERTKVINQVIKDWIAGKISNEGLLSTNSV